ncbi:MAG: DUF554 domain-containing protein [Sphaerochaetaceae bacterium]|nr:DUF554 domain-containing protein [Sphaerochaetaceae bacterium]
MVPVGLFTDVAAITLGGLSGGLIGRHLTDNFKKEMNSVVSIMAMGIALYMIPKMEILGAVMLAVVSSYCIGSALNIDGHVNSTILRLTGKVFRGPQNFDVSSLSVLIVLMGFGGGGIMGSMTESMTGDSSLLMGRAVCDFITSLMFGTTLGPVAAIAGGTSLLSLSLFYFSAQLLMPYMNDVVYANFIATGGMLTLMGAVRMFGLSKAKPMNAVLSVILIVPITILWQILVP